MAPTSNKINDRSVSRNESSVIQSNQKSYLAVIREGMPGSKGR